LEAAYAFLSSSVEDLFLERFVVLAVRGLSKVRDLTLSSFFKT
jgi:hypothetical protein